MSKLDQERRERLLAERLRDGLALMGVCGFMAGLAMGIGIMRLLG